MSVGLDFILRARTGAFTAGLATANNSIESMKKSLRTFDVGNGLKQALGVGGIIAAFRTAITNAQELRDEAAKIGREVDGGTRSVAELGDALEGIGKGFKNGLTEGLSFFTRIGDAARRYFQDVTEEQERAAQKMVETTGKAADEAEARLKKSREENSPEKQAAAQEKLDRVNRNASLKGTDDQKKLLTMINDRADLAEKLRGTGKGTVAFKEIQAQIGELDMGIKQASDAMDKEAKEAADKKKEEVKKLVEKFAPTVEELAKQETGGFVAGDDPRLKARQALDAEDRARMLFERGDIKGGLALAQKAKGIRDSLTMQTSDSGVLTPKAAEQAVSDALTTTNDKLDQLTTAVQGIIKAQK